MNITPPGKYRFSIPLRTAAIASIAIFLAHGQSAKATTLLNDTFADNSRTNQSLTSSAAWYQGGGSNASWNITAATGVLQTQNTSGFNPVMTAYFTNSGQVSLLVGQTMSLSFNASFTETTGLFKTAGTRGFRFGIYNSSGGTRQAADQGVPTAGSNYSGFQGGYAGYSVFGGFGTFNSGDTVGAYEAAAAGANGLPMGGGSNTALTTTPYVNNTLVGSTNYSFSLSLTRTALGLDYSVNYAGITLSGSDNTSPVTSFDTISFFWLTDALGEQSIFALDNVNVSVVPEPSTCMLLGLGLGTLCLLRRPASNRS